jgi:hypothetical protein
MAGKRLTTNTVLAQKRSTKRVSGTEAQEQHTADFDFPFWESKVGGCRGGFHSAHRANGLHFY